MKTKLRFGFTHYDVDELEAFLSGFERSQTLREVALGRDLEAVVLRHDIDSQFERALRYAEREHELGLRASYYPLPGTGYYADKPRLYAGLEELVALGHEVGLHLNVVRLAFEQWQGKLGDQRALYPLAAELLRYQLAELREAGFEIVGTAAHGAAHVDNLAFWDEHEPADFGLSYEAYHLIREDTNYISDNHGRWRSPLVRDERQTHFLIHWGHWPEP